MNLKTPVLVLCTLLTAGCAPTPQMDGPCRTLEDEQSRASAAQSFCTRALCQDFTSVQPSEVMDAYRRACRKHASSLVGSCEAAAQCGDCPNRAQLERQCNTFRAYGATQTGLRARIE